VDVTAIEDAIHAWVVAGSGLDADHVIWGAEATGGGPVPSGTYISMRLLGIGRVSDDWLISRRVGGPGVGAFAGGAFSSAAFAVDAGIVHHVRGTRHPNLELTCFAGDRYGAGRAQMVLERVLTSIRLPSVGAALRAGGVGIGVRGLVRVASVPRSTMFDPRAIVEVGLHVEIDVEETGQSIEHVEAEVMGVVVTVDAP
jgi:hypothetical protein